MTSKRHHSVPRFSLERFAGSDGLLWLHDVAKLTATRARPEDSLVERWLYAPEIGDDLHDDALETFLAQNVDGPAAGAIDRLVTNNEITAEDRQTVSMFLAFQEVRIPRTRDVMNKALWSQRRATARGQYVTLPVKAGRGTEASGVDVYGAQCASVDDVVNYRHRTVR